MSIAKKKLKQLNEKKEAISLGGGINKIDKQHSKGKMTARERIDYFFDAGTFVELDAFVQHRCTNFGYDKQELPAESVVTGYGKVNNRIVYIYSQDFTVTGGSLGEMHAKKITKVMDMAAKTGAPIIGLNDSGGARVHEAIDALAGFGEIFYRNSKYSGVVPQISAIMGPCAGGAVYSPALTDFVFMVDKTSQMFLTGPKVIKTVTGEDVTSEALGGANTHNSISGCAHYLTQNDKECLDEIKRLLSFLPSNNLEKAPEYTFEGDLNELHSNLSDIIPDNPNKAYDMFEVISTIVDHSDFMEYQPYFAKNIITGFGRINGKSVGIIANQPKIMAGVLDTNSSDKHARFVRTCNAFNIPIITIVDVPGFLPGTAQEYQGVIRHGAKVLFANSEATVPKITLITRKAYGGAYLAMCCKSLGADMVYAWPTAEIAVMGSGGAIPLIYGKEIKESNDPQNFIAQKEEEYKNEFASPYQAAKRGLVDDVIDPSTTRQRIIDALDLLDGKKEKLPLKKHGNMPL